MFLHLFCFIDLDQKPGKQGTRKLGKLGHRLIAQDENIWDGWHCSPECPTVQHQHLPIILSGISCPSWEECVGWADEDSRYRNNILLVVVNTI